jgi:hypothetical protein
MIFLLFDLFEHEVHFVSLPELADTHSLSIERSGLLDGISLFLLGLDLPNKGHLELVDSRIVFHFLKFFQLLLQFIK